MRNSTSSLLVGLLLASMPFAAMAQPSAPGSAAVQEEIIIDPCPEGGRRPCVNVSVTRPAPDVAAAVPGAPGQPGATVSGNLVTITWTAPTSGGVPTHYLIVAGSTSGGVDLGTHNVGPGLSVGPVSLPDGAYFIRLIAVNADGQSAASVERSFTVGVASAPGTPGTPSASVAGTTVTITWAAPTTGGAPTHYLIVAGTTAGGTNLGTHNVGAARTVTATLGFGPYFIRVIAVNARGQSAPSGETSFTIGGGVPGIPGTPSATVSGSTVTVIWTAPSSGGAPTHYLIVAGSTSGASNLGTHNVGPGTSVTATVAAGTYFIRVIAVNASGQSQPSGETAFTIGGGGGGGTAGGWNGVSSEGRQIGFIVSNDTITEVVVGGRVLSCIFNTYVWNLTVPVTSGSFSYTRPPSGGLDPGFTFAGTLTGSSATGTLVLNSTDTNCAGTSATITWTASNSGPGMPLVPGAPTNFQPYVFGRSVNFDWRASVNPGGATSYDLEIGTTQGASNVGVINITGLRYILSTINPGNYFARVRGRNASGIGPAAPDYSFFVH